MILCKGVGADQGWLEERDTKGALLPSPFRPSHTSGALCRARFAFVDVAAAARLKGLIAFCTADAVLWCGARTAANTRGVAPLTRVAALAVLAEGVLLRLANVGVVTLRGRRGVENMLQAASAQVVDAGVRC